MKTSLMALASLFILLSFTFVSNTISNADHIETIKKQLREHPSQTLGFGASKIYHVYDISIPKDAEITENAAMYIINPVEITMAVSNSVYDITKQKVPYKMNIFKEYKGSHAMGRKNIAGIEVIWQKKESTKEFSAKLKELKNMNTSTFDELFSPEDDFPEEWKSK